MWLFRRLKMDYEIYGQGKPLILIHGGGSTIQSSFEKVIPLFSKSFKFLRCAQARETQSPKKLLYLEKKNATDY